MSWHLTWLWFWFLTGSAVYMVKRAYYLIEGENPVANNLDEFIKVAWVPLGFRFIVDSAVFWTFFSPLIIQAALAYFGWEKAAWVVSVVTQFAVCAFWFGLGVDPIVDWGIGTVVVKVPFLKDWWPQMPPPLKKITTSVTAESMSETPSGIIETTKVTATKTIQGPPPTKDV